MLFKARVFQDPNIDLPDKLFRFFLKLIAVKLIVFYYSRLITRISYMKSKVIMLL